MYTSYFGLHGDPFGMTPDPSCLYVTEQHREAFSGLAYTILNRRGFGVLTGEAGTGKTTIVAKVVASLSRNGVQTSIIFHPTLSADDFLEMVLIDFGIPDIPDTKAQRLKCLHNFLVESHTQGKISTLIIDEAHKLSPRLLEEVRLFGNFDYTDQKLLQILLVGQTELDDILALEKLRQLKQRIAVRLHIGRLAPNQVEGFIRYRWLRVGGSEPIPFSAEALQAIKRETKGLPRVINAVCDNALLLAFADQSKQVQLAHVRQAIEDLLIGWTATPAEARPAAPAPTAVLRPAAAPGHAAGAAPQPQPQTRAVENVIPSPIRVPEFGLNGERPSLLSRLAAKLRTV